MLEPRQNPCSDFEDGTLELLRDAARVQMGRGLDQDSALMEKVKEKAEERFVAAQKKREELQEKLDSMKAEDMLRSVEKLLEGEKPDEVLKDVKISTNMEGVQEEIDSLSEETRGVTSEDWDSVIRDLEKKGFLDSKGYGVALTSKGAELLGRGFLSRILINLARKGLGAHRVEDAGYGPWKASTFRAFEPGDPYDRISIETSLLATLERKGRFSDMRVVDLRVYEPRYATEVHFGVLVDQSASMKKKGKMEAAVETALALYELMRIDFPEDKLRIYAFSESVKQVQPWELIRMTVPQQFTDIRAPLRTFRLSVSNEPGNKQAHLITDSAPNYLDGEFVGFSKAMDAVLEEARLFRLNDIVLNVIMLDDDPELREMAEKIARMNLGRVFFTDPKSLGEALVMDYLSSKRELLST